MNYKEEVSLNKENIDVILVLFCQNVTGSWLVSDCEQPVSEKSRNISVSPKQRQSNSIMGFRQTVLRVRERRLMKI